VTTWDAGEAQLITDSGRIMWQRALAKVTGATDACSASLLQIHV